MYVEHILLFIFFFFFLLVKVILGVVGAVVNQCSGGPGDFSDRLALDLQLIGSIIGSIKHFTIYTLLLEHSFMMVKR